LSLLFNIDPQFNPHPPALDETACNIVPLCLYPLAPSFYSCCSSLHLATVSPCSTKATISFLSDKTLDEGLKDTTTHGWPQSLCFANRPSTHQRTRFTLLLGLENQIRSAHRTGFGHVELQGNVQTQWLFDFGVESFTAVSQIPLSHISKLERVDSKPYCLLLEAKARRYYLSFDSDGELYDWQEDVYSRSPLGAGQPFGFIHNIHVGVDGASGAFDVSLHPLLNTPLVPNLPFSRASHNS